MLCVGLKYRQRFKQLTPGASVWLRSGEIGDSIKCVRIPAIVSEQGDTAKTYVIEVQGKDGDTQTTTVTGDRLEYRDTEPRLLLPEVPE